MKLNMEYGLIMWKIMWLDFWILTTCSVSHDISSYLAVNLNHWLSYRRVEIWKLAYKAVNRLNTLNQSKNARWLLFDYWLLLFCIFQWNFIIFGQRKIIYLLYTYICQFKWVSWQPTQGPWLRQNCTRLLGVQSSFIAVQTPESLFFFFFGLKKQI